MKNKEYISTGGDYHPLFVNPKFPTTFGMTKNESFERDGYLFVPNFFADPENLYYRPPFDENGEKQKTGTLIYVRKDKVKLVPFEQEEGSLARYNIPHYKPIQYLIQKEVERLLGIDLFPTYYFDRFYFAGQKLHRHIDRESCEISVSLQISSNANKPWPFWFQRPDDSESCVVMKDGDAVIYKGCEREHWRDTLESRYNKVQNLWRTVRNKKDDTYHHQIFFHFVNAQGPFLEHAFDSGVVT